MPLSRRKRATSCEMRSRSGLRVICVVPLTIFAGSPMDGDLDDVVDVVALNLPGNAREGNEVVGDDDDAVGVNRVGQRESERSAGRRTMRAIGVAEVVGRGRGDDRDVDVHLAILNRLPASTVRAQHA